MAVWRQTIKLITWEEQLLGECCASWGRYAGDIQINWAIWLQMLKYFIIIYLLFVNYLCENSIL